MKLSTFLKVTILFSVLSSCKTIDVWDKGYPKDASELTTEEAKTEEFNKFAIHEGVVESGGYIQTQRDKDSDKYYSLGSYSSVIKKVSPSTESRFEELNQSRRYTYLPLALVVAGFFIDSKDDGLKNVRTALMAAGLGGVVSMSIWQGQILHEIKEDYHRDLNKQIFGAGGKDSASITAGWQLGLTYKIAP